MTETQNTISETELVEVTEFVSSAPAAIPAVAMGKIARSSLERRLTMIMRESFSYRVPLIGSGVIGLALLAVLPGWSRGQQLEGQVQPGAGLPAAKRQPGVAPQSGPALETIPAATAEVAAPGSAAVAGTEPQPGNSLQAAEIAPGTPGAQPNSPLLSNGTPPASNQQSGAAQKIQAIEARLAQLVADIQQIRGSGSAAPQHQQQAMYRMMAAQARSAWDRNTGVRHATPGVEPMDPFGANPQAFRADKQRFGAMRAQKAGAAGQATDERRDVDSREVQASPAGRISVDASLTHCKS